MAGHAVAVPTPDQPAPQGSLEIRGPAAGLLDDPFALRVRGAGPDAEITWRGRYRDDDGRVWRAVAWRPEDLSTRWLPAKDGTGDVAALRSLRPVAVDVRAEAQDGRAAGRTFVRAIVAGGVRTRRWRDGLAATLHVPAGRPYAATAILDASGADAQATAALLAAPLLASRGVLALVLAPAKGRAGCAERVALARERLGAMPGAGEAVVLAALDPLGEGEGQGEDCVVLPPNVGVREVRDGAAAARAAAWDALLQRLGAAARS
jgi:hypothetical protein